MRFGMHGLNKTTNDHYELVYYKLPKFDQIAGRKPTAKHITHMAKLKILRKGMGKENDSS